MANSETLAQLSQKDGESEQAQKAFSAARKGASTPDITAGQVLRRSRSQRGNPRDIAQLVTAGINGVRKATARRQKIDPKI